MLCVTAATAAVGLHCGSAPVYSLINTLFIQENNIQEYLQFK